MSILSTGLSRHEISRSTKGPNLARGPPAERIWVRPKEAARLAGIGLTRIYEMIASGEVVSRKIGRMRLISVASIKALGE
jgi:excisionase family DNA binding protein